MFKKFRFIILNIILVLCLMIVEIFIIKAGSQYEATVNIVFAKSTIPAKSEIKKEMLETKKVSIDIANDSAARNIKDIVGKKAKVSINKGEMIYGDKVSSNNVSDIEVDNADNRIYTLELKPDQASGWKIRTGQKVDIIYVPNNVNLQNFYNMPTPSGNTLQHNGITDELTGIRVAAVLDDKCKIVDDNNSSSNTVPKYICLEVTQSQDEFLAYCKSNGRLELSAVPESN